MAEAEDISTVNVYARIPARIARALRVRCAETGASQPSAIADAILEWLKAGERPVTHSGELAIPKTGETEHLTEKHGRGVGEMPYEVVIFIRKHWADPNCRECVLALARIWDVGDPEIMDSLTRNCKTFKRASDMVVRLEAGSTDHGGNPPDYETGVKQILSRPRAGKPKTRGGKS